MEGGAAVKDVECYMVIERGLVPLEELTHSEAIDAVRQLGRELQYLYDKRRIDTESFPAFRRLSQVKLERVQVGELKRCPRCAGEGYTQSVKKIDDLSPSEFIAGTP